MGNYRAVLAVRRFRLLWIGDTVSTLGDSIGALALIWLVYTLRGSVSGLGLFVAAYTAPVLLGGPLVGAALDRFDRRRLMVADNALRGVLVALIPLLHAFGVLEVWELYVFAVVYGLLKMVPLAGVPSLIPELLPSELLDAANALETISFFLGGVAGAGAAGVLIAAVGGANALWVDAASYAVFAVCLVRIGPLVVHRDVTVSPRPFADALRFALRERIVLATTLMFVSINVGSGIVEVILPVYVRRVLHAGAQAYGLVVATCAAAGLVAAIVAGARSFARLGRAIAVSELAAGLSYAGLAGRPSLVPAVLVFAGGAFFLGPLTVWAQTIRMRLVPADLRGRTFGLLRTVMQSAPPLGALLAAPLLHVGGWAGVGVGVALLVGAPAVLAAVAGWLREDERAAVAAML